MAWWRRRATPATQAATSADGIVHVSERVRCRLPELRLSCMLQMVDHLRLVGPELLEEVLGQRLGSGQPKPIALER